MAKEVLSNEVLKLFRDKFTGKRYEVGSNYPADDPERVKELQDLGFIAGGKAEAPESKKTKAEKVKTDANNTSES